MGLRRERPTLSAALQAARMPKPPEPVQQVNTARNTTQFKPIPDRSGWVGVKTPYQLKDMVKTLTGREWSKKRKQWEIPFETLGDALKLFPEAYVDPALLEEYKELQQRNERKVAAKTADVKIEVPGLKAELYPYQQQGLAFLDELREGEGSVLAYDMGLGKSILSIAFALHKIQKGEAKHCLIVCPAPLKFATWAKEIEKFCSAEYIVVDGGRSEEVEEEDGRIKKYKGKALREIQYQQFQLGVTFTIMNYELFLHDFDLVPELNKDWILVLDEAHRVKNPKSQTSKNLIKKARNAGYKILGTGTPLENSIEELWQLVDLCKPGLLGSWWNFQQRYIEQDFFGRSTGRALNERLPELKEKIEPVMIRKTKEEALPDLPPLTVIDRWVDMTKDQADLYAEVKEGVLTDGNGNDSYLEALAQLTRFQQICDSPALLNDYLERELPEDSGKLRELPIILSEIRPEANKVIVFTQYETMARLLVAKLRAWYPQFETVTVTGKINDARERQEAVDLFQEDPHTRFIVLTTAGNYGLNLFEASYVIAYDETWNPQKMEQVYSRAHRNGQKSKVIAINLKTRETYEEKKAKILEGKRTVFAAVINDDETAFAKMIGSAKALRDLI